MNNWTTEHDNFTGISRVTFPGGRISVEINLKSPEATAYTLKDGVHQQTDSLEDYTPAQFTRFLESRAIEAKQLEPFKQ